MTTDMSRVIEAKSDQLNASDLLGGPRTIRITGVSITQGEQPVSVRFEGDEGKPWKPCKTTSRLMVAAWGPDAKEYTGKSLTLYRDPKVKWGGLEVGGVRISHMSHIEREMVVALQQTKGKSSPHTVKPLKAEAVPLKVVEKAPDFDFDAFEAEVMANIQTASDKDEFEAWWGSLLETRKVAGGQDKQRAITLATKVKDKIAELAKKDEV